MDIKIKKIVNFLDKPKYRTILLTPQTITWIITTINLYLYHNFDFYLLPYIIPIHLISAGLIILFTMIILYVDFLNDTEKYYKK